MNYNLKLAIRNLLNQRIGSFINIIGFSLSLTICLIIALYVQYEFSFEKHNPERDKIYRLVMGKKQFVPQPIMFFKPLTENVPELHDATLVFKSPSQFFMVNNERQTLNEVVFTNDNFLSLFKLKMRNGAKGKLLDAPNSVFLSKSAADKIFPNGDAVGKLMKYQNRYDLEVKGVFDDAPITANYHPNILINYEAIKTLNKYQYTQAGYNSSQFYFRLLGSPDLKAINAKMNAQAKVAYNDNSFEAKYQFQPLSNIHLYSADTSWDVVKRSDIKMVRVFVVIAFLILLIAMFNFINLSLSLSAKRNFNTGIQKVFGANGNNILNYFLIETSLIMGFCIVVALTLTSVLVPEFNTMMETNLSFTLTSSLLWLTILIIAFLNILLPTLILTKSKMSLNPVLAVKSKGKMLGKTTKSGYSHASQLLTITQIAITIVLITSIFTMNKQFDLMLNKQLGFDKSQLITINNPYEEGTVERYKLFKQELEKLSVIEGVCGTWNSPGTALNNGDWLVKLNNDSLDLYTKRSPVDADYFKTMKTKFLLGKAFGSNDTNKMVINKTCWEQMGVENPIGMTVERKSGNGRQYEICGVIDDIQNQSLKTLNDAAMYYIDPFLMTIMVRITSGNIPEHIAKIEEVWNNIEPNYPFSYKFVDEILQANYSKEIRVSKLLNIMSALAIILSMLGLFALSLQIIERKTKEIGIRKINGATIKEVLLLLNKGFVKWVIVAFVIATPIAYYAMNKWLENFAYKTTLSWWIFALAGVSALLIALLTVSWQSYRAASRNPVEALRYE